MSAIDLEAAVKAASADYRAAQDALSEFMKPINSTLNGLYEAIRVAADEKSERFGEVFKTVTYEDLTDPLTALVVYQMLWDGGRGGVNGYEEHLRTFFPKGSYVLSFHEWYGATDLDHSPVLCFRVGIPKVKDEASLRTTADAVAPLYEAAAQISDGARIVVFEDSSNSYEAFKIVKEAGLWSLQGRRSTIFEHEDLVEVLRKAPTYE
jgi:hypothetical protein